MKLINIVGARPNFMKIAPLMRELSYNNKIETILLHTGQHYDEKMSHLFFNELSIPQPQINLEVGSDTQAKQVAKIMERFDETCDDIKPDAILVVGDVNSTMACSLVASKRGIKIIHLEAGLRSFDREMPEEINRLVTDALADLLLTPSDDATDNLFKEGVAPTKIFKVGNIMIDTLYQYMPLAQQSKILDYMGLIPQSYSLITLHRPSNVDGVEQLSSILNTFCEISKKIKIVFPIHPRTNKNIDEFGLRNITDAHPNLILTEPLGYFDFQKLMLNSKFVLTDSGGVQEETTALKIPCMTLRKNTERPVTVWEGSNELIGNDMDKLLHYAEKAINNEWKESSIPDMWDGKTSERVVKVIEEQLINL